MKKSYTKSVIRRGSLLSAAFALVVATFVPFASTYADALNPLTDRSLTLSSGSPGWAFSDGSGNSTYAPPNSGTNGQKTGNTFEFKVSSTAALKAMTFQYCTESAGICMGPGDIPFAGTAPAQTRETNANSFANKQSDLEVVLAGGAGTTEANFGTYVNASTGQVTSIPAPTTTGSNYLVYYRTSDNGTPANPNDDTWAASTGWTMTASVEQDASAAGDGAGTVGDGTSTGKPNQITLSNTGSDLNITAGTVVKVVFFGTNTNYITNPGSDAFFVKINTFSDAAATTKVDGGVTVANVMNESIQITTKVLETMDFSVGTVDPFTLESKGSGDQTSELYLANGRETHVPCEPILKGITPSAPQNTLNLGDMGAEFSLKTTKTYSTHSYWRLSSNSSAGATVYYSGVTLSNTVNDKIDPIYRTTPGDGLSAQPKLGMEQFGLALANGDGSDIDAPNGVGYAVNYTVERGVGGENLENGADNTTAGIHASVTDPLLSNLTANASYHAPQLYPLLPTANYGDGAGVVNANYTAPGNPIDTNFAFDENSNTIPVALASQDSQVVDCVTGKMRYIANIAATTPAGIYTTKINYIAAPQY